MSPRTKIVHIFYGEFNLKELEFLVNRLKYMAKLNSIIIVYRDFKLKVFGFDPHANFSDNKLIPIDHVHDNDILSGERVNNFHRSPIIFAYDRTVFPDFYYVSTLR